jgi:ribosomal protein S18 acetylase RimI-like enzyme
MRLKPVTLKPSKVEHLSKLVALDQRSVDSPWTMNRFEKVLNKRSVHGIGAFDQNESLRGYVIYDSTEPNRLAVVSLLVDLKFRRMGIGTGLLDCVRAAMNSVGVMAKFHCYTREDDDAAIRFLASYKEMRKISLQTSLVRGEPRDVYQFVFQEALVESCV